MTTTTIKPLSFLPPASGAGKWHLARACSDIAACGSGARLDTKSGQRIQVDGNESTAKIHPICCRRCLRGATKGSDAGDCYTAACQHMLALHAQGLSDEFILVHGEVIGQGPLDGIRHGHAWLVHVESDMVVDTSNGRRIELPAEVYERIGRHDETGRNRHEYTHAQMIKKMLASGHYGPWDLKTSTGL